MADEEKKKGIPAHEMVIKLLTDSPKHHLELYLLVFIKMYSLGTIIPSRAIPDLINTFQKAFERADESTQSDLQDRFDEVIQKLQKQLDDVLKEFITKSNDVIRIDTSDEACGTFRSNSGQRLKSGQKIVNYYGKPGIVAGVAPLHGPGTDSDILWLVMDEDDGNVCWIHDPHNLIIS